MGLTEASTLSSKFIEGVCKRWRLPKLSVGNEVIVVLSLCEWVIYSLSPFFMGFIMWNKSDLTPILLQASEQIVNGQPAILAVQQNGKTLIIHFFASWVEYITYYADVLCCLDNKHYIFQAWLKQFLFHALAEMLKQWHAHPNAPKTFLSFTNMLWASLVTLHDLEMKLKRLLILVLWLNLFVALRIFLKTLATVFQVMADLYYSRKTEMLHRKRLLTLIEQGIRWHRLHSSNYHLIFQLIQPSSPSHPFRCHLAAGLQSPV